MTKLTRNQIDVLNDAAYEDLTRAQAMLDGINMILGAKYYGLLNKRVVAFENPNGTVAERYAHCNDAWALAQ